MDYLTQETQEDLDYNFEIALKNVNDFKLSMDVEGYREFFTNVYKIKFIF